MPRSRPTTTRVALIPSVSGGLGHVTRLAKLAHALSAADRSLSLCFVLPELRLRHVNIQAVEGLGYPVRFLPNPVRHERDEVVRGVLGDIDVVIEDTERRLIAYRSILPRLRAWISIPMLPLWDELFLDWTLLEQADHILYTYPAEMPVPDELERFRAKLTVTGPFVAPDEVPRRDVGRRRLGLHADDRLMWYAPRGFPFGRAFGSRLLNAVVGGFMQLRRRATQTRLALTGVPDVDAIQPRRLPPLPSIDGLDVRTMLPRRELLDYIAAADVAIVEGTSGLFDAAVADVPVIMVPGPIYETTLEADWVASNEAGLVVRPDEVTRSSLRRAMQSILVDRDAATARARRLREIVGGGGERAAVEVILRVVDETR